MTINKVGVPTTPQAQVKTKQGPTKTSLFKDGGDIASKQTLSRGMNLNTSNPFALPPLDNDEDPSTLNGRAGNAGSKIFDHLSDNGEALAEGGTFDLMTAINSAAQQSDSSYESALQNIGQGGVMPSDFVEHQKAADQEAKARQERGQLGAVLSNDTMQKQNETVAQAAGSKFNDLLGNRNIVGLNTGAPPGEDDAMRKLMAISFLISGGGGIDKNNQPGQDLNVNRLLFTAQNIRNTMASNKANLSLNLQQPMAKAASSMQFGRGPTPPGGNGPGSTGGPQSPISE